MVKILIILKAKRIMKITKIIFPLALVLLFGTLSGFKSSPVSHSMVTEQIISNPDNFWERFKKEKATAERLGEIAIKNAEKLARLIDAFEANPENLKMRNVAKLIRKQVDLDKVEKSKVKLTRIYMRNIQKLVNKEQIPMADKLTDQLAEVNRSLTKIQNDIAANYKAILDALS